jgi:hypothetical protein
MLLVNFINPIFFMDISYLLGQIINNNFKGGVIVMSKSNTPAVPSASNALKNFKMEVASELGIANYESLDKGQLSSRQNGNVGGNMTKKMVAFAEQALSQGQSNSVNSASSAKSSPKSNS